jgi:predicted ATPase
MGNPVTRIKIQGFKSIRELDLKLNGGVNILVGSNGSGKSNFSSFFKLLNEIINERLENYTMKYGADYFLFCGSKETKEISSEISFGQNEYRCKLEPRLGGNKPPLFFNEEKSIFYKFSGDSHVHMDSKNSSETQLHHYAQKTGATGSRSVSFYVYKALSSWRLFHFHDTSDEARVKRDCEINDNQSLKPFAENLAAFLYKLKISHKAHYDGIVDHIRLVAPFFKDFDFNPSADSVSLMWKEKYSDDYRDAYYLSDGTLRFICLATLLLQPTPPSTIVIDEPELGLHPYAIEILAAVIKKAAATTQILVSTQSVQLIDNFSPEDIIVVDRKDKESVFRRLERIDLGEWIKEYSLGEIWQKNLFGANP